MAWATPSKGISRGLRAHPARPAPGGCLHHTDVAQGALMLLQAALCLGPCRPGWPLLPVTVARSPWVADAAMAWRQEMRRELVRERHP